MIKGRDSQKLGREQITSLGNMAGDPADEDLCFMCVWFSLRLLKQYMYHWL